MNGDVVRKYRRNRIRLNIGHDAGHAGGNAMTNVICHVCRDGIVGRASCRTKIARYVKRHGCPFL